MSIYLTIKTSKLIVLVPVSSGNKFSQRVNNLVPTKNFVSGFGLISTRMSFTEMGLNSFHILGPFRARITLVGQDVLERRDFLNGVFHLPGRHVEDGSVEIFCPVVQDFCSLRTFLRTAFFCFRRRRWDVIVVVRQMTLLNIGLFDARDLLVGDHYQPLLKRTDFYEDDCVDLQHFSRRHINRVLMVPWAFLNTYTHQLTAWVNKFSSPSPKVHTGSNKVMEQLEYFFNFFHQLYAYLTLK